MPRPVTLFTGQWADLPLETLAQKVSSWGFDGLELACWGDHFEVDKALSSDGYVRAKRDLLEKYGLGCWAISNHLVGQCVCDPIDERHSRLLPPRLWGDGDPEGVRQRAAQEIIDTGKAAKLFGVDVVNGFTGSSVWSKLYFFPPPPPKMILTKVTQILLSAGHQSSIPSKPTASNLASKSTRPRSPMTLLPFNVPSML